MISKIKKYFLTFIIVAVISFVGFSVISQPNAMAVGGGNCTGGSFFLLPSWYEYIPDEAFDSNCNVDLDIYSSEENKNKLLSAIIGPIALAVVDILLTIAGMVAVGFVIFGGVRYMTSQGDPSALASAKNTIMNALIGIAIAVLAIGLVRFIGSSLQ